MLTSPQFENEEFKFAGSQTGRARSIVAWSGLVLVLLQSVCTFFTAVTGLRLLIGAGALAAIMRAGQMWDKVHSDLIRIPMIVFAVCGSLLNVAVLKRIRSLRARPAAKWRMKPPSRRTIQMERVQFILSIATLVLFAVEEATHWRTFHRF